MNRAVFSDRDNVLVEDLEGYIYEIEKFKLLDGVIEGLRLLNETDYKVIIITNQTGIGSGYYTKEDYKKFTEHMLNIFRKNSIRIDAIYYCPHHPDLNCDCRKPKSGMFEQAKIDFDIDYKMSWMIGDKTKDVEAGKNIKAKTIAVIGPEQTREKLEKANPDYIADNFLEAVKIILGR